MPASAFVVDEVGGSWGNAQEVPRPAALNAYGYATVDSVSCASADSCAAGGNYAASSGNSQAFVADKKNTLGTSTSVSLSAPTVTYGNEQAVRASVTVTSPYGTPYGAVTLTAGPATVCTITLASGTGSCTLPATALPAGTAQLTATYNGSATFTPSASAASTLTVYQATTTTSLTLSQAAVSYGNEQTVRASVTVTSPYGTPDGTVTLTAVPPTDCTITLASGTGTCTLPAAYLPAGPWQVTASYAGTGNFIPSTSAPSTLTVTQAATTTSLTLSQAAVSYGNEQTVRASVTVTSPYGTPYGAVTLTAGPATVCTITLASGTGSCTLPAAALPVGTAQLTATYNASRDFTGSASAAVPLTIAQAATTTSLTLSQAAVSYGNEQTVRASVTVTSPYGTPDGTVTLTAGPATVCTITLASGTGSCTLPAAALPVGTAQLTATYHGSANFAGSASAAVPLTTDQAPTTTSLNLSASATPYGNEQAEQVLVTVTSPYGTPDGTVTVTGGTTTVCTITLASGTGTCVLPTTALPAGLYQVKASYAGSASFAPSASGASIISVSQVASATTLTLSPAMVTYGNEQAELMSVAVIPQYGGTPDGTVTISSGSVVICQVTLSSSTGTGTCTLSAAQFPPGTVQLTASYSGSAEFTPSVSAAETLTVAKAPTTTTLKLSAAQLTYGHEQAEQLSAAVAAPFGGTADGTVMIKAGTATVCTVTLTAGQGACTLAATALPGGTAHLTATYGGGADFAPSASPAVALTVARATSRTTLSLSTARLSYGREQAERVTVIVTPQYSGTPGGKVTVKAGTTALCTITLTSGKGEPAR